MSTPEQQVRDMLERMGYENAQSLTAGDVVELANIIAENTLLKRNNELLRAFSKMSREYQAELIRRREGQMFLDWFVSTSVKLERVYQELINSRAMEAS
jgi:hypothetical protein